MTDNPSVPSSIIVQVEHDVRARLQRSLNKVIELREVGSVEGGGGLVVADHVLPGKGDSNPAPLANTITLRCWSEIGDDGTKGGGETHKLAPF